jgi:hypothetical protein
LFYSLSNVDFSTSVLEESSSSSEANEFPSTLASLLPSLLQLELALLINNQVATAASILADISHVTTVIAAISFISAHITLIVILISINAESVCYL